MLAEGVCSPASEHPPTPQSNPPRSGYNATGTEKEGYVKTRQGTTPSHQPSQLLSSHNPGLSSGLHLSSTPAPQMGTSLQVRNSCLDTAPCRTPTAETANWPLDGQMQFTDVLSLAPCNLLQLDGLTSTFKTRELVSHKSIKNK